MTPAKPCRHRPREIRRLITQLDVISKSDGTFHIRAEWIPPAGGLFTRLRVAAWICDTLNDKLETRQRPARDSRRKEGGK
jgi:hypothetical protein